MTRAGTDAVEMLRWGLRRYRALFVICLLLGAGLAPVVVLQRAAPTDAEALVIATRLDMDLIALPRYAEAIFNDGRVGRAVAFRFPDLGSPDSMIPGHVSLVAEQDSIVFQVVGRDVDPARAADIADVAADAFVDALNAGGTGVGSFAVQSPAEAPSNPDNPLGTVFAIPVGLVAGVVLALAAVCALLVIRRPVIDGKDAEEATGVPSLGTLTVPRTSRGRTPPPDAFSGLIPVCRRLLAMPTSTIVLVSRDRDERVRRRIAPALGSVLSRVRDVQMIGPSHPADGVPDVPGDDLDPGSPDRLTIVYSSDPLELVHAPELTATVLVVPEGVRSTALHDAVVEHLGGSAEARVLMTRKGRRLRRSSAGSAATPPSTSGQRDVATADVR